MSVNDYRLPKIRYVKVRGRKQNPRLLKHESNVLTTAPIICMAIMQFSGLNSLHLYRAMSTVYITCARRVRVTDRVVVKVSLVI